jgi:hypothetical protein
MFYVVESKFVGRTNDHQVNADRVTIQVVPATGNLDKKPRIEGWCGTNNDWAVFAHGEYSYIEEARDAIDERFGAVREVEEQYDLDVIEAYLVGEYDQLPRQASADWLYECLTSDVTADTTDQQIDLLVEEYAAFAAAEGIALTDIEGIIREYRGIV